MINFLFFLLRNPWFMLSVPMIVVFAPPVSFEPLLWEGSRFVLLIIDFLVFLVNYIIAGTSLYLVGKFTGLWENE